MAFSLSWLPAPVAEAADPGQGPQLLAQSKEGRRSKRKRRRKSRRRNGRKRDKAQSAERAQPTDASGEAAAEEGGGDAADAAAEGRAGAQTQTTAAAPSAGGVRRSNRMEFDARLIRGETAGSGAVVLFDRGQRELPALTKTRTRFLDATVREVYDGDSSDPGGR